MTDENPTITVRAAADDELVDVMRVLDGAVLEIDAESVENRLGTDAVLVAERGGHVVGALVRDGERVEAVAVRRQHRAEGVGSALVREALARTGRLTAEFDPRVRAFYESLGFEITDRDGAETDERRLWGEKRGAVEERSN